LQPREKNGIFIIEILNALRYNSLSSQGTQIIKENS
jgi:hypothetical protein